jgi:hypothetical protein
MGRRDASILTLRAAGLYLWIRAFERMDWFVAWLAEPETLGYLEMDPTTELAIGLVPLLMAVLGTLFLLLAPRLGWLILPARSGHQEQESDRPAPAMSLFEPASALIGVVLVVAALPMLPPMIAQIAADTDGWSESALASHNRSVLVMSIQVLLQLGLGVGLFLGGHALGQIWRRCQVLLSRRSPTDVAEEDLSGE